MFKKAVILITILVLLKGEVTILGDDNYTSFVKQNPHVLVKFYAPWCGHCKTMAPQFESLSLMASQFKVAKVDATVATKIAEQVGVSGYPTLKMVVNGEHIDYEGGRKAQEMFEWVTKFISSNIEIISQEEIDKKRGNENFIVVTGVKQEDKKIFWVANAVSNNVKYFYQDGGDQKVTLYLKKGNVAVEFDGDIEFGKIKAWAAEKTRPVVVRLRDNEATKMAFSKEDVPALIMVHQGDSNADILSQFENFCEGNSEKFSCSEVTPQDELFDGVLGFLREDNKKVNMLAYLKLTQQQAYVYNGEFSGIKKETVGQFVSEVEAGKVEKRVDAQKQKEQKKITYENVVVLTNQNYNQTLKNNKYVFVEYYSPNCGHCVNFWRKYEKMATQLKQQNSEFVIAAIDMNGEVDVNQYVKVDGYPTLRFFVNGIQLEYSGEREIQSIISFMKESVQSRLLVADKLETVPKPAVFVFGIDSKSELHFLPILLKKYPSYEVTKEGEQFRVELHVDEKVHTYTGSQTAAEVEDWVATLTEPILADISSQGTKRLDKALSNGYPLLIIVNRELGQSGANALKALESHCIGKDKLACGYYNKDGQDYEGFNAWLNDKREGNRLIYLNTSSYEVFFHEGELATIDAQGIEKFVNEVESGVIKANTERGGKQYQEGDQENESPAEEQSQGEEGENEKEQGNQPTEQL